MEAFALGELRLTPRAFWRLTWAQYGVMAAGYHHREVLKWQRTRWLAAQTYNAQRTANDALVLPTQLLWLPGDPLPDGPLSPEAYAEAEARLAELDADLN